MKSWVIRFPIHLLLALQFYTRIPVRSNFSVDEDDLSRSLCYGPLVGLLVGGILWGGLVLCQRLVLHPFTAATLLWLLYFMLTGGIHFDGIADTFDAAGSGKRGADLLPILKDPRIGSMGAIFLFFSLVQYGYFFFVVYSLPSPGLFWLWPWCSARFLPVLLAKSLPYLQSRESGEYRNHFVEKTGVIHLSLSLFLILCLGFYLIPFEHLWGVILLFLGMGIFCVTFYHFRFRGINGDLLGASIVLYEIAFFHYYLHFFSNFT